MKKHLSKQEAADRGWYCRSDLKHFFRLKPAREQRAAGTVWQGQGWYYVYSKDDCVPMRPYRSPSASQLKAIAEARLCVGTRICSACGLRFDVFHINGPLCVKCEEKQRTERCRQHAAILLDEDTVVLDSETTGLGDHDEIVEICIIDHSGVVLMNSLVRPTQLIPDDVVAVHGITNEDVINAPSWADLHDEFLRVIEGKRVAIYGEDFDIRLISQTASKYMLPPPPIRSDCVMQLYAEWYGEKRSDGCYRWQKLWMAAMQCGINHEGSHRAHADCLMTLGLLKHMAAGNFNYSHAKAK